MQALKRSFIFFFLSLMLISMVQPELCPEARIMQNGHQIHGLCARRANSKKAALWPPMCAKRIMVAYPASESLGTHTLTLPLIQFLTAVLFICYRQDPALSTTWSSSAELLRHFNPHLRAGTLRGPPFFV